MNILKSVKVFALAATAAVWTSTALGFVPVEDPKTLAEVVAMLQEQKKQLTEAIKTNGILDEQTQQLILQVAELENVVSSLRDGFELEDLLAGLDIGSMLEEYGICGLQKSLAAARSGDWGGVFCNGKVGGVSASEYATKIYESVGLSQKTVDDLSGSDDSAKKRIGDQAATNVYTSMAAENAIEQTTASLERTKQLIEKIDNAENLKQAIDLNTRVTGELVIALLNQANMEAIQTVAISESGIVDAATMADDEKFLTLTGDSESD